MKVTVSLLLFYVFTFVSSENKVNLDEILGNDTLIQAYFDCFMDKGDCPPEGDALKVRIPHVLENGCPECTEEIKKNVWKVITHLIKNKPDLWQQLESKYDPQGKFKEKYFKQLSEKLAENGPT
ncbi:OS-D domain containing protein, partial [Asbolus verrucosus]